MSAPATLTAEAERPCARPELAVLDVLQPGGGRLQVTCHDGADVEAASFDVDGRCTERRRITVTPRGEVLVSRQAGTGPVVRAAGRVERWTTPRGTAFDHTSHEGGIEVERTLGPGGHPSTVRVLAPWGEHLVRWTADGAMEVTWCLAPVHGSTVSDPAHDQAIRSVAIATPLLRPPAAAFAPSDR